MAEAYRIGGTTFTRCIIRRNIRIKIICARTVRIGDIYVLITTENTGALAQIVNRADGEALGFTCRRCVDAARMRMGHTPLGHQGGVAPSVLTTRVPDVAVAAPVHRGITLSAAGKS